ncbi:MAG: PKD domain-containing protein [Bacteroidales bacterium]
MKTKILLLCFAFFGIFSLQAQSLFTVGGYVTNLNGGAAIANHTVYIMSDSVNSYSYSAIAITNANGYYSFSVTNIPTIGTTINFYIYTYDCNGVPHSSLITNANPQNVVNFAICNGGTSTSCNAMFNPVFTNGHTINFQDLSTGSPTSWFWNFGDGITSTLQNPTHSYNINGSVVICLTITSNNCTSTYCDSVYIQGGTTNTCNAAFTFYPDSLAGLNAIHFMNNSTTTYTNYQVVYLWNFGDGTTSTQQNPIHAFVANPSGGYNVCLTMKVLNSAATVLCENTYCSFVNTATSGTACQNSFTYTHQNLVYAFSGHINSSNTTNYYWSFGDGSSATGQYITHVFTQPASGSTGYHVCLTTVTSNNNGTSCSDTSCQFIAIANTSGTIIQGFVTAGNYDVSDGYVLLYQANTSSMSYALIDTLVLDSIGYFIYNYVNVPPTNPAFLIKAVMNPTASFYSQYAPTFYHNTVNWFTATAVFPSANTVFYNINMIHLPTPVTGNGTLGGNVFSGGTKANSDLPLSGVELILSDENDNPLKIAYSNSTGNFSFNNLAMGNYKLHIEIAGVNYTPYLVTLSSANPGVNNITVTVNNSGAIITGIEKELSNTSSISDIYPNPSTSEAFIDISSSKTDKVIVSIYDNTGIKLSSIEYNVNGNQRINLNQKHFASGIYTVKIEANNGVSSVRKLVIAK